jgi:hypothetical protein
MHSSNMSACRHILDIFINVQANQPNKHLMSARDAQIRAITFRIHDGPRFTEKRLESKDEAQLLRQFWLFIAPNDLLIAPNAKYEVKFIRQRSSVLGIFPALIE